MASPPYMKLYVADYLGDTHHLTALEHGAYLLLLMSMWRAGGALPSDEAHLARLAKCSPKDWKEVRTTILPMFREAGGQLIHKRVERELGRYADISAKRGATGGAEGRWGNAPKATRSERLAAARVIATHTAEEWAAMIEVTGSQCVKCLISSAELYGGTPCKDHIKPIYQGGSDGIMNIQPLCRECNSGKGKEAVDYRERAAPGWLKRLQKCLPNASLNTSKPEPEPKPDSHPSGESARASLVDVDELQRQTREAHEAAGEALASMATHPGVAMIAPLRSLMSGDNPCDWTADIIPAIHSAAAWHIGKGGAGSMKTWTAVAKFATENRDQRLAGPGTGKTNGSATNNERDANLARAYASTGERPKLHR